jgi:putative two-component system response regulator
VTAPRWPVRILLADRPGESRAAMQQALASAGYEVVAADSAADALALVLRQRITCLLLETDLPGLPIDELLRRALEEEPNLAVVIATALNDAERAVQWLRLGALDFLVKPVDNARLTRAVERALRERDARIGQANAQLVLRDEVTRLSVELRQERTTSERLSVASLESLIHMIETRDRYLAGHSVRVGQMAASIASELGRTEDEVEMVRMAGRLHDLGMICIGEGILSKAGPLTESEFARVREHVIIGAEILQPLANLHGVSSFVRSHHERWDGSGYPDGLAGEQIPWGARLIGAAEVFDALTTSRPYRREQPLEEAIERMRTMKGTTLDPDAFDALAAIVDRRSALVFIEAREESALNPTLSSEVLGV